MLTAIAVLALLTVYNLVSARVAERPPAQSQPGDLLRITADVVRQEAARQDALRRAGAPGDPARATPGHGAPGRGGRARARDARAAGRWRDRAHTLDHDPLAAEIGELGTLDQATRRDASSDHERKLTEIELAEHRAAPRSRMPGSSRWRHRRLPRRQSCHQSQKPYPFRRHQKHPLLRQLHSSHRRRRK